MTKNGFVLGYRSRLRNSGTPCAPQLRARYGGSVRLCTLLTELTEKKFDRTSPVLRENIIEFYADLSLPIQTRKDPAPWQGVLTDLDELKAASKSSAVGHPAS